MFSGNQLLTELCDFICVAIYELEMNGSHKNISSVFELKF